MKKIFAMAILATVIVGGVFFNSCQKEDSLVTKTEDVSAAKEQKGPEGTWEDVEYAFDCFGASGELITIHVKGQVLKYKRKISGGNLSLWIRGGEAPEGGWSPPIIIIWGRKSGGNTDNPIAFQNNDIKINDRLVCEDFILEVKYPDDEGNPDGNTLLLSYDYVETGLWPVLTEVISE